ncbi:MAG: hypothetical protein HY255_10545 [Betaproteobacteria bacterium]|nr:hypothetical protein [Betaproteobacteria bacterium]
MTKFLRNTGSMLRIGLLVAAAAGIGSTVVSCGGGGVAAVASSSTSLTVLPSAPDLYENTPTPLTVAGGKPPYKVFPANLTIIPQPTVNGSVIMVTANPVAADTSVKITVSDSSPSPLTVDVTANVKASQLNNSITIIPTAAGQLCGTAVCSGGDAVITTTSSLNGVVQRGRSVRFDVYSGDFNFVTPSTNTLVTTITVTTDNSGIATALIRVKNAAPSQTGIVQVTDVPSGQFRRFNFPIQQTTSSTAITIIPSVFTWQGAYNTACVVGGVSTHYIFGGTPPYTITTTVPQAVTFATTDPPAGAQPPNTAVETKEGGAVLVSVTGQVCSLGGAGTTMIVRDATGRTATFTVNNNVGTVAPPVGGTPVTVFDKPTVNPASFSLDCGATGSSFIDQAIPTGYTGSAPVLVATPLEPTRISTAIAGGIFSATRLGNGPGGAASTLVRLSNGGPNFLDFVVNLNGTSPWACSTSNNTGGTPISTTTGHTAASNVGQVQAYTFTGGIGPYSISSAGTGIVDLSTTGVGGSFTSPVSLPSTTFPFFYRGVAVGTTFITIIDSSPTPQVYVIVVTVS